MSAKNVARVGESDAYLFHKFNHNDRGNPHPQYAYRGENGWYKYSPAILGGWTLGSGGLVEVHQRTDGDLLTVFFRIVVGSSGSAGSYLGINLDTEIKATIHSYVGNGMFSSATGATHQPLTVFQRGGAGMGIEIYDPGSGKLIPPSSAYAAQGNMFSGTIQGRY